MKTKIIVVLIVIFNSGCFDMFTEKQTSLVGNISLINPDNHEDKNYKMVLYEDEINKNVIEDYIIQVEGNDSILFVKGMSRKTCEDVYFKIGHHNGKGPLKIEPISSDSYNQLLSRIKSQYQFLDDSPECP